MKAQEISYAISEEEKLKAGQTDEFYAIPIGEREVEYRKKGHDSVEPHPPIIRWLGVMLCGIWGFVYFFLL